MTESEWFSLTDPVELLDYAAPGLSKRKTRLLALACCRLNHGSRSRDPLDGVPAWERALWEVSGRTSPQAVLRAGEEYADQGKKNDGQIARWLEYVFNQPLPVLALDKDVAWASLWRAIHAAMYNEAWQHLYTSIPEPLRGVIIPYAPEAFHPEHNYVAFACVNAAEALAEAEPQWAGLEKAERLDRAFEVQSHLFRDVIGNPLRNDATERVTEAGRRNPEIRLCAVSIYSERQQGLLPHLVELLTESGADIPAVREHLNSPVPFHPRGCWLVDAALGVV